MPGNYNVQFEFDNPMTHVLPMYGLIAGIPKIDEYIEARAEYRARINTNHSMEMTNPPKFIPFAEYEDDIYK